MAGRRHIVHTQNIIFRNHISHMCVLLQQMECWLLIEHKAVDGVAQKFELS
jgi:hypothetical protein